MFAYSYPKAERVYVKVTNYWDRRAALHSQTVHKSGRNRPFYRYGGHIALIRFKEYYRMSRGHEDISFVFSSAFRDIFSLSSLRIRL